MKKQKTLRTLLATLLLVVMLVMALPVNAAETTGSITLTGVEENATVKVYKLAAFNYDSTVSPQYPTYNWETAVNTWLGAQDSYKNYVNGDVTITNEAGEAVTVNGTENFSKLPDYESAAKEVYGAITAAIKAGTIVANDLGEKASQTGDTVSITGLDLGTYLVLIEGVKNVYQPIVQNVGLKRDGDHWVNDNATLDITTKVKSTSVNINKTVEHDNYNTTEVMKYTITANVPTYPAGATAKKFVVSDNFNTNIMELVAGTITVSGRVSDETEPVELDTAAYTLTTANAKRPTAGNQAVQFSVDFNYDSIKGYSQVEIKYDAKLKPASATTIYTKHNNDAYLDYSNNPYDATSWETKTDVDTTVETYGFTLNKVDKDDHPLQGAEFAVKSTREGDSLKFTKVEDGIYYYDANGTETALAVDTEGKLEVRGLKAGTYYYEETKAPMGYNKLPDVQEVTVGKTKADDIKVTNKSGFALPITGGMGTVIFTISGVVLIVLGAVILVSINKKRNAKK